MTKDKDLKILIKAAHAGGKVIMKYFGQSVKLTEKSTAGDFQTIADRESEKVILSILKEEFSSYNIFSEEGGGTNKNSDYTFVVDPLDGTNNFVLGLPLFSVSIALLYKKEAILGVVYNPITNQTFYAMKNCGAYLNNKKIRVNNIKDFSQLSILYSIGYTTNKDYAGDMLRAFYKTKRKRIMNNWSIAFEHCMLASGKIESCVVDGLDLHDFAAGKLIALEAGASVIDFTGKKEKDYTSNHYILSNTDVVNKYILGIVKPLQK